MWINVVSVDPQVFGHLVAIGETAIAIALLFGFFTNLASLGGVLLSIVIWTTRRALADPTKADRPTLARRSSTCSSSSAWCSAKRDCTSGWIAALLRP